jgi:cytochrome P450
MSDAAEPDAATSASEIPGPNGPEMLTNIRLMRRHPPRFLAQCAERYGPVVRFPIPRSDVLLVTDPADVRRVLQGNHTAYGKRTIQYDTLALVTGHGLLASDGELWKRMRRVMSPSFHRALVGGMTSSVSRVTQEWSDRVASRSGPTLDLDAAMLELSLKIVAATLFGGTIDRASTLVDAVMDALHVVVAKAQQPLRVPRMWPTPGNRRLTRSLQVLDAAVDEVIAQRRSRPAGDDVLWALVTAMDEGIATRREVRDEVVTLIVAGHETVAATLTWTWFLLAGSPGVRGRLHSEVDALEPDAFVSSEVLGRLPYTRAVVDECLRLYPPAWVVTRRGLRDDVLSGHLVPANATVILSPFVIQHDPHHWPRPDEFEPDRFLGSFGTDLGSGPLTYFPFGAGPRLCIGRDLALLEAPLVVAALARRFAFELVGTGSPELDFGVTLRPKGGLVALAVPR